MRSPRFFAPVLALLAAAACSGVTLEKNEPTPSAAPAKAAAPRARARGPNKLGVPPGHYPPAGQCRVWMPDMPPGRQRAPESCRSAEREAPAGSWILYRPTNDRKVVHVRVVDTSRRGRVVRLRIYDAARGTLIRES